MRGYAAKTDPQYLPVLAAAMVVVHDEHVFLLHQSLSEYAVLPGSRLSRMSVRFRLEDNKYVGQLGLPIYVKHDTRQSRLPPAVWWTPQVCGVNKEDDWWFALTRII